MKPNCLNVEQILKEELQALRSLPGESRPLSALCISGGGIRSATFGLGIIQAFAEQGILEQFDYLSTVSGGGYIGSWLSAWATREGSIGRVIPYLKKNAPSLAPGKPDPIRHLREYNHYLSPRMGFTEDVWTLLATVVRNIVLNWLVFIPVLLFFAMMPHIIMAAGQAANVFQNLAVQSRGHDGCIASLLSFSTTLLYGFALFHMFRYLPGVGGEDQSRSDYLWKIWGPLVLSNFLYCAYDAKLARHDAQWLALLAWNFGVDLVVWALYLGTDRVRGKRARLGPAFGMIAAIALLALSLSTAEWLMSNRLVRPDTSWGVYTAWVPSMLSLSVVAALGLFAGVSSRLLEDTDREWLSRTCAGLWMFSVAWAALCTVGLLVPHWLQEKHTWGLSGIAVGGTVSGWVTARIQQCVGTRWASIAAKTAPAFFILALGAGLAVGTDELLSFLDTARFLRDGPVHEGHQWGAVAAAATLFALTAMLMSWLINVNKFSLNAMYRDRLIRAYLGASNSARLTPGKSGHSVNAGLNHFTGFALSDNLAMHELIHRPFHLLNLTLNLTAGENLAWQERKAMPFSVTPLHSGSAELGYRMSKDYAGGITLGTAMSISGAAASPQMGERSSVALGFIMTILNARLGGWLGNPGPAGRRTWKERGPRSVFNPLLREAFGRTDAESEYVYLSDGGHFDNLGLYEMVRRRCRTIVVVDSGCDPGCGFEGLGNALRKIRIDFRVPIIFEKDSFEAVRDRKMRCAVAKIDYPTADGCGEAGALIYIKPMVLGCEPADIASYAHAHAAFPHEATSDQWFNESQTESYRMLGKITVNEICRDLEPRGRWLDSGKAFHDFPEWVTKEYLGILQARAATA